MGGVEGKCKDETETEDQPVGKEGDEVKKNEGSKRGLRGDKNK